MSDNLKIKHVRLQKMHGHQTCEVDLYPGLNIIYGMNGTGKTTLLHVIVNLLDLDLERFLHIIFESILVVTFSGHTVFLCQHRSESGEVTIEVLLNDEVLGTCTKEEPCPAQITEGLKNIFGKRPVYLPAYRSMLEGAPKGKSYTNQRMGSDFSEKEYKKIIQREFELLSQRREDPRLHYFLHRDQSELTAFKTLTCRAWFGEFVPVVRYPSIAEVHDELENEIERARYVVAAQDQENISTVFRRVLEVILLEKPAEVDQDVSALIDRVRAAVTDLGPGSENVPVVYSQIAAFLKDGSYADMGSSDKIKGILKVYDDALSTRAASKEKAYAGVDIFRTSVNRFLGKSKELVYEELGYKHASSPLRRRNKTFVALPGGRRIGFNQLSSGERHVLTLLFAATHMSPADGLVIIDEPELSLHLDWQRIILGEICKQAQNRQIIACTHAPEVAAEHMDAYIELTNALLDDPRRPEDVEADLDLEE